MRERGKGRRLKTLRPQPAGEASLKLLSRGWCLGGPEFKQQKLEELDVRRPRLPAAALRKANARASTHGCLECKSGYQN